MGNELTNNGLQGDFSNHYTMGGVLPDILQDIGFVLRGQHMSEEDPIIICAKNLESNPHPVLDPVFILNENNMMLSHINNRSIFSVFHSKKKS